MSNNNPELRGSKGQRDEETGGSDGDGTPPPEKPPGAGVCDTCSNWCQTKCSHCQKAYYCSTDCQKKNRASHKPDCFPAELIANGDLTHSGDGKTTYWIATRDIKPGELIFCETPIIMGPNSNGANTKYGFNSYIPVCLGCCKALDLTGLYKCSKCAWPVCDINCENDPRHRNAECSIFRGGNVIWSATTQLNFEEFNMVSVLRCVLLKRKDPKRWDKLMKMIPKKNYEQNLTEEEKELDEFESECQLAFFNDHLGISDITLEEILHISKLWYTHQVQSLRSVNDYCKSEIFYFFSFMSHSCAPNCKSIEEEHSNKFNTTAIARIPKGKKITYSVVMSDSLDGTIVRRNKLQRVQAGYICKCERCTDPTELGTYISAVKCPSETGTGHSEQEWEQNVGFLLPADSLNEDSIWECNSPSCKMKFTYAQISSKLASICLQVNNFLQRADELKFGMIVLNGFGQEEYSLLCEMEVYLEKMDKFLHPNHYFKFALAKKMLIGMSNCISPFDERPQSEFALRHRRIEVARRMQELGGFCVKLVDKLLPGMNVFRGKILYFVAFSKWVWIRENVTNGGSVNQTIEELQEAGELTRKIEKMFANSQPGSIEMTMLDLLQTWEGAATSQFLANPSFASRITTSYESFD